MTGGAARSLIEGRLPYLLRLLRVIDKPFKVGRERTDDDVSLFLLVKFVVHAHAADAGVAADEVVEQMSPTRDPDSAVYAGRTRHVRR